jgi:NADPH:quinone reductase-like Zn-dependent oxidoreductase
MKAVRVHQYGSTDVLRFENAPEPVVGDTDVLIRVIGSSVNPADWKFRQGHLTAMIPHEGPFIPGWDVSGVIHAVGSKVSQYSVGESVFSRPELTRNGTYAEFVSVREAEIAKKPTTISHIHAGVLPLASITAWESIVTAGQVSSGQRVLIHAAAGGVGSIAVQLAKLRGAYVIGTASGSNRALVESLGVDEFIDYRSQKLSAAANGIDLVLDTIGGDTQDQSWAVMAKGGILVSIVSNPPRCHAERAGVRSAFVIIKPNSAVLREIAALVDAGKLRPLIGAEFSLEDIKWAHALSESGRARGKIALHVGRP